MSDDANGEHIGNVAVKSYGSGCLFLAQHIGSGEADVGGKAVKVDISLNVSGELLVHLRFEERECYYGVSPNDVAQTALQNFAWQLKEKKTNG